VRYGETKISLGTLSNGYEVLGVRNATGDWGLEIHGTSLNSSRQPKPIQIEFSNQQPGIPAIHAGFDSLTQTTEGFKGLASISYVGNLRFNVEDTWRITGNTLRMSRRVVVFGTSRFGFLTAMTFINSHASVRQETQFFVPGMIYGGPENLPATAIGGSNSYRFGRGVLRIREDRLPSPVFGVRFKDSSSIAVLNPSPHGETTRQDSQEGFELDFSIKGTTLIDEGFHFGSIGVQPTPQGLEIGYWFPGTEGEVTYNIDLDAGGPARKWRGRYHPITDRFIQQYEVSFRFDRGSDFPTFCRDTWRWSWSQLEPTIVRQDIASIRRSLIDLLSVHVKTKNERTLIPLLFHRFSTDEDAHIALLGFVGKSLDAARQLLYDAEHDPSPRGELHRQQGTAIIDTFVRMKMSPPSGNGLNIDTGEPTSYACSATGDQLTGGDFTCVFLRDFTDDVRWILEAYRRERLLGRTHPTWLAWAVEYADWLLTQRSAAGGLPRSWIVGTSKVLGKSLSNSIEAVPVFVLLAQLTGESKYMVAAIRTAEFAWKNGHERDMFVGGVENQDFVDKEAGAVALGAYMSLYEATHDRKWLDRAARAADFTESWIYIWNVPMLADDSDAQLKHGVPTVGAQIIGSGGSAVDEYMSGNVTEYGKLYRYSGDLHYLDVAKLLLHDTKVNLSLPRRTEDRGPPGWQQEGWSSLAVPRGGSGDIEMYAPSWVTTSHLDGILGLEEFDEGLYKELSEAQ
jgi:hypothetical protein